MYQNQELNILEIFKTLIKGKLTILYSTISVLILSLIIYIFVPSAPYSIIKTRIYTNNQLLGVDEAQVMSIFVKNVYSESSFNEWSKLNPNNINYPDFSGVKKIKDLSFLSDKDRELVFLPGDSKGVREISIKSDDLDKIRDYYKYLTFVSKKITKSFLDIEKREIDDNKFSPYLSFLDVIKKNQIIEVQQPMFPADKKISIEKAILLSTLLGFFIGIMIVLFKRSYHSD